METVTFTCGQCGKVMAVHATSLGKQVECPHCHQVVTAFAAAPPEIHAPGTTEQESIFGPPAEDVSDDLFGTPTPAPRIEIPPELPAPNLLLDPFFNVGGGSPSEVPQGSPPLGPAAEPAPAPTPEPPAASDATVVFHEATPATPQDFPPVADTPTVADHLAAPATHEAPQDSDAHSLEAPARTPPRRPAAKAGVGVPLLLIFLLPYSLVATIAAGWLLYQRINQVPPYDPLERLPDPKPGEGGARRIKFDTDIPAKLKTSLKEPLRVGDVEVTPLAVERSDLGDLSLTLKLRNLSQDVAFAPISPSFLEFRRGDRNPYTFVEIGSRQMLGGTLDTEQAPKRGAGQKFDGVLNPGEEMTVRLRTYLKDKPVLAWLDKVKGEVLWRVQVRRGLVQVKGREVSATALIGVRINPADIRPAPEDASLRLRPAAPALRPSKSPEFSNGTGKVGLPRLTALL